MATNRTASVLTAFLMLALLCLGAGFLWLDHASAAETRHVDVISMDSEITPVMARYVHRSINKAEKDGAAALVIEMNTPGGLSSAMDDITADILQSKVPVVVYVTPRGARAASAGVYITYAAHVAAMAPGTNIGSASPIFMGADGEASDGSATLKAKVTNDAVSQIKNYANFRDRNAEWAEQAVRQASNITADEALQMHVIDVMAPDLPTLLDTIDGRTVKMADGKTTMTLATKGAEINSVDMSIIESFLQVISDPTIAYILLSLGMLGLVLELSHPGAIVPGVLGVLFLLVSLYSLGTLPVNWAAVLLLIFAFVLFAIDLFVPSFGMLTIGGLISFVLGSYLLIDTSAGPGFEIARPAIWTVTACIAVFFLWLAGAVVRARFRPHATGTEALVGEIGEVRRALNPVGMVYVYGELWSAVAEHPGVELGIGAKVVVTAVEKMRVRVRPATLEEVERQAVERAVEMAQPEDRAKMPRPVPGMAPGGGQSAKR
ncbi:MAG TPA: nodulation protein NfeD [Thermomicrobiales bacterium]|nr:nodulation protein NfeD [Thermomicrobiales bacterium]